MKKAKKRKLARWYGRAQFGLVPRQPLAAIAADATSTIIDATVLGAIQEIASECARDLLSDPEFRKKLREATLQSASAVGEAYRR